MRSSLIITALEWLPLSITVNRLVYCIEVVVSRG